MYKGDTLYRCSEERMKETLKVLSAGDEEALTKAFRKRMKGLGADIVTDDLGNIYATVPGSGEDGKKIVLSCPDIFDAAGICTAVEIVETIVTEVIPHKHSLTVLLWNSESRDPELVPAMGIICRDYLPEEVKHDYKEDMIKPDKNGDRKYRLNTHDFRFMLETHTVPVIRNRIGIADMIPAVRKRNRAELHYNEKLTKLAEDSAVSCNVKYELLHYTPGRDTWIAAHMLPTAAILVGTPDAKYLTQAGDILLTTILQADKM